MIAVVGAEVPDLFRQLCHHADAEMRLGAFIEMEIVKGSRVKLIAEVPRAEADPATGHIEPERAFSRCPSPAPDRRPRPAAWQEYRLRRDHRDGGG